MQNIKKGEGSQPPGSIGSKFKNVGHLRRRGVPGSTHSSFNGTVYYIAIKCLIITKKSNEKLDPLSKHSDYTMNILALCKTNNNNKIILSFKKYI